MSFCSKLRSGFSRVPSDSGIELRALEEGEKNKISHFQLVLKVLPFLWPRDNYFVRFCVILSLVFLTLGRLFNVMVPLAYRGCVNSLNEEPPHFPLFWMLAYTALRFCSQTFTDFRDTIFLRASQNAISSVSIKTFAHLHSLSLRFHLNRKTGSILQGIERGTNGITFLLSFLLFNVVPVILEISFVCVILFILYGVSFSLITACTMIIYMTFTITTTEWRIKFRRQKNQLDNDANNKAVDSLINFETVKYFCNENKEITRYSDAIYGYGNAIFRSQDSMLVSNFGRALIVTIGVTSVIFLAAYRTINGSMTVGDFVLVNSYILQLYIPLNYLGSSYRMIKNNLADMENLFHLLQEPVEIQDNELAPDLKLERGSVTFDNVSFHYDRSLRVNSQSSSAVDASLDDDIASSQHRREGDMILDNISLHIPAGKSLAIVGPTGAGKSTISRLLFRFYDPQEGRILIDNQDIRTLTQKSVRSAMGVVPQDTVLFNDTIRYNIAYGKMGIECTDEEIYQAAASAQIHDFIKSLPEGYDTVVGERGLRLSGGEKQRVAIARAILKNPRIMILDEATSALDTKTEREIQSALGEVVKGRTTIVIAHRLSTVIDSNEIVVLKKGRIAERGTHRQLLSLEGEYFQMWMHQQESQCSDRLDPEIATDDSAIVIDF